jgi:putative glutamine amidotransferase
VLYADAVEAARGDVLWLPADAEESQLEKCKRRLSALLLPGGPDVDPGRYGQDRHINTEVCEQLDKLEFRLTEWALENRLPILGICRGHQVLAVAFGGSLVQHLPDWSQKVRHRDEGGQETSHQVRLRADSMAAQIAGAALIEVNSSHHQGVLEVPPGLEAVGWSEDGLTEALQAEEDSLAGQAFVVGVQWHPEREADRKEHARGLFEEFVRAAGQRSQGVRVEMAPFISPAASSDR